VVNGKSHSQKEDWRQVEDKDIPAECVTGRPNPKSKNYLSIPSTERAGVANVLGRNCFAVYALLTTAQAMDPTGKWHKLPVRQLSVLELDRFKVYRAIAKLEAAGIVKSRYSPGRKTLYRLMPEL
jgi:hypothetical protein